MPDLKPKLPFPATDIGAWLGFAIAVVGALAVIGLVKKAPVVGPLVSKIV
jgi:hypothetical protein